MLLLLVLSRGLFLHPAVGTAAHGALPRNTGGTDRLRGGRWSPALSSAGADLGEPLRAASWFWQWVTRCCRGGQGRLRARAGLGWGIVGGTEGWDQFRELHVPYSPPWL